jgi:hypothetical protein
MSGRRYRVAPGAALAAGFAACVVLTTAVVALGGDRAPVAVLPVLAVPAVVLAWFGGPAAGFGCATLAWLFWDGFLVGREAQLVVRWPDAALFGAVAAAALLAGVAGRVAERPRVRVPLPRPAADAIVRSRVP